MNQNGQETRRHLTIGVCDNCDREPRVVGYYYYNEACRRCGGNVKIYVVEIPLSVSDSEGKKG